MKTSPLDSNFLFTKSFRNSLGAVRGVFTPVRWSVFCRGGRYGLTGALMHRGRSK